MKKVIMSVLFFVLCIPAFSSSLSSTFDFTNSYVYRGINYYNQGASNASQGTPVIQGSLDYVSGPLALDFFTTPECTYNFEKSLMENDTDLISSISLNGGFKKLKVGTGINYYEFIKNDSNNMFEYALNLSIDTLRFDSTFVNNYVGLKTTYYYNQLSYKPMLNDKFGIVLHVGYIAFGNNTNIDNSNYFDYKVGIDGTVDSFTYEIDYSNTILRKIISSNSILNQDAVVIFMISKTINIF